MKIGLIGGGGFAKEVAEIAELSGFEIAGYFSDLPANTKWLYLGKLSEAEKFKEKMHFAFCIGAVNGASLRRRREIILSLKEKNLSFETLISPKAVISAGVQLGVGVIVAHGVILSVDARIGDFCILNTGAVVGHDAKVGFNSILAPLCFLGGNVEIESDVLVGPNSSILELKKVGRNSVIGCGAVVHRNTKPNTTLMPINTKVMHIELEV
jgi:acetyltransferase EpsM